MQSRNEMMIPSLGFTQELMRKIQHAWGRRSCRSRRQRPLPATCQVELLEDRRLLTGIFTADDVVIRSGDAAPEAGTGTIDGTFSSFSCGPVINESGTVLFQSAIANSPTYSDTGLFYITSTGDITTVAREGQSIPEISGGTFYRGLSNVTSDIPLPFNENAQAVFVDRIQGAYYTENTGIFIGNGDGTFSIAAREGSEAPGAISGSSNGRFNDLENSYVIMNDAGQIAFVTELYDTDNGSEDDQVIYSTDANGNLIQIAREGQLIPGSTTETFTSLFGPSINNAGQVAFWGATLNASVPDGIYVSNGDGTPLRVVMQEGQAFGSFGETFKTNGLISASLINESGDVAFRSHVDDGNNGTIVRSVFVRSGNGDLREVARPGDILPNGETYYDSGIYDLVLNYSGDLAFTGKDEFNNVVLFRSDADSSRGDIKAIVREGQMAPDGNLSFYSIYKYTLNDSGQIAFTAVLWDGINSYSKREALFLYDDVHGLVEIAQVGDQFDGSTISEIYFAGNDTHNFLENNGDGLNNQGQITFSYELADGNQGIAVVEVNDSDKIDLRVVSTPTVVDANGETPSLPANQNWVSEWSSFWVEIWVSTSDLNTQGVAAVTLDLSYKTEYTTATEIEFGAAFTQNQSGTINDLDGLVENLSAATTQDDLGMNGQLLFARIKYESLAEDQVPLDLSGPGIGPYNLNLQILTPQLRLTDNSVSEPETNDSPGAGIWANPFDLNDDDAINFRDLILFVSAYGEIPSQSSSPYAWFADLNQNDRVEFRDLIFFASNYGKRKSDHSAINYPDNFPTAWNHQLIVAASLPAQQNTTPLAQSTAEEILDEAKADLAPHLTSADQVKLETIQVQVVDLEGSTLGLAVADTIYLDQTAADFGWFVDPTPEDHSEFQKSGKLTLIALPDSEAAGQIDLWTVIRHEIFHLLGYEHTETGLMESTLLPGERKLTDWETDADYYFASLQDETELSPF
ncbi:DUF7453 family protein [Gimesia panareensis]|uniref:DUF7453 family protein n=1 Tax=Gimesia panareensis TaxID=2527978 RepID=UPI00118BE806|nr:choice-of-anchor tandem repeat NxxGxxAF-containing protein [Gimesia panareensis]QDU51612.1 hypothetical protein Pan110_39790 [Gimesia panareensis]